MKKIKEKIDFVEGKFKLSKVDDLGNKEILIEDNNTIVNGSFEVLANLLLSADSGYAINTLALGDGGIYQSELLTPRVEDTQLYNQTYQKSPFTELITSFVSEMSITFSMTIEKEEGNGSGSAIYNEAGLYTSNGTLFARKTFLDQIKTPNYAFVIDWTIIFK